MKTLKVIFIFILSVTIFGGAAFFAIGYFSPKPGGIRIETTPKASVFIDNTLVGETPYEGSHKTGTILLRLVPKDISQNLMPFETSIKLSSGIETVVERDLGISEASSSGYIISFEKTKDQTAGLITITQPPNAQVLIDGISRGFSPYSISAIAPAMHTIIIKSPGYTDLSVTIKTIVGYKLTFYGKLGIKDIPNSILNQQPQDEGIKTVKILNVPTGFLKVHSQPGGNGDTIAQVQQGQTFQYIDTDVATGWIEIQYEASKSGLPLGIPGWIPGNYATISSEIK